MRFISVKLNTVNDTLAHIITRDAYIPPSEPSYVRITRHMEQKLTQLPLHRCVTPHSCHEDFATKNHVLLFVCVVFFTSMSTFDLHVRILYSIQCTRYNRNVHELKRQASLTRMVIQKN